MKTMNFTQVSNCFSTLKRFSTLAFLLIVFIFPLGMMAQTQANLTHHTNAHFNKGYFKNMTTYNNTVIMSNQATSMTNWWTQSNDLPRRVQNHEAVVWNDKVYITGGMDVTAIVQGAEQRRVSPKVYSATIDNGLSNYTELSELPEGVMHHASIVANGYLYVIGGYGADTVASNRIYYAKIRANGTLRPWVQNSTNLPEPLWGHTASFVNGYIIITGGSNLTDTTAVNTVYSVKVEPNGELTTFTTQTNLDIKRNQHAAAVYNNRIFVAGGFNDNGTLTNTVVYADVALDGSISAWLSTTNLPEPLYGLTGTCDQGLLTFAGGYNDNQGYAIQYAYYTDVTIGTGFTWAQSGLYYEHWANSQSFIHKDKLYMLGGYNIFNVTMERVYYCNLNISSNDKMTDGIFLGEVYDLGTNRHVDTLYYVGQDLANYYMFCRTATNGGTWTAWDNITGSFYEEIDASLRYVQYMFVVNNAPTNNTIALDTAQLRFAAVQLAGTYYNETWTLANSPYWVTADVFIDGTVEVEAGVVFTFSEGTKMQVNHILNCNGTAIQPITFTSFTGEDGYWNGLHFSSSSNNNTSTLNYVIIENAGFIGFANLNCYNTNQPTINYGVIRYGTNSALYCDGASPVFNSIYFNNNQNYLIRLERGGGPVFNDHTLANNAIEKVHVLGGYMSYNGYWDNMLSEYHIETNLYTYSPTLTIEKGVNLLFETGIFLHVSGGSIIANGSNYPDSIIVFTAKNGTTGSWEGVTIATTNNSSFKYCNFTHGNTYNLLAQGTNITLENCNFSYGVQNGLYLSGANILVKDCNFFNNQQRGIYGGGDNNNLEFNNCEIYNNGSHGIECSGSFKIFNSHIYNNAASGVVLQNGGTKFEPQLENVLIENNGTNGIWANNCFPDFINVDVLNNTGHGFLMNANVWPEYYDLNLSGNATNDFRVSWGSIDSRSITWEVGQYPFVVINPFGVNSTGELTIEKGMTLKFMPNAWMGIGYYAVEGSIWNSNGGKLNAKGVNHPDSIITFTSHNGQSGGWQGILFYNTNYASELKNCIVENALNHNLNINSVSNLSIDSCIIRNSAAHGISGSYGTYIMSNTEVYDNLQNGILFSGDNSNIQFNNCDIHNNGNHGFECSGSFKLFNSHIYNNTASGVVLQNGGSNYEPQLENVLIENNGSNGIWANNCFPDFINVDVLNNTEHGFLMNANVWPEYYDLNLSGNATNDLRVSWGSIDSRSITWEVGQYPFIVINPFGVNNAGELTIEKGMTLKFMPNAWMGIGYYSVEGGIWNANGGKLNAKGVNHPDSIITFTSYNGQQGGWHGINFYNTDKSSELKHCIVENALNQNLHTNSIYNLVIDSCIIRNSASHGIISYYSEFHIKNSQIVNNHGYGIYYSGNNVAPIIGDTLGMGNDIFNNNIYDIYNAGSSDIYARHNFFNTTDGFAIAERIYDNSDEPSYGIVHVTPPATESNNAHGQFIAGTVMYNNNDSTLLKDVDVVLLDSQTDTVDHCLSNTDGFATFVALTDDTYTLDGITNRPWIGVNATDALLVLQHFSNIITLNGIRLKAADVNASSAVNATDALAILQRFTNITNSFPAGDWAFLAGSAPLVVAANNINTILWALCYGDVNGSGTPSASKATQTVTLSSNGQMNVDNLNVSLPLYLINQDPVGAVSLSIAYPEQYITIDNVSMYNSTSSVVYTAENGILNIAWCSTTPVMPATGTPLLLIDFTINNMAVLNNGLQLDALTGCEIADNNANVILNAALTYPQLSSTVSLNTLALPISFNVNFSPNPATDKTVISYALPENGSFKYSIYSSLGALLTESTILQHAAGYYNTNINTSHLSAGTYFVRIEYIGETNNYSRLLKLQVY